MTRACVHACVRACVRACNIRMSRVNSSQNKKIIVYKNSATFARVVLSE